MSERYIGQPLEEIVSELEKRIKDIEPNNANRILYEQWVDKLTDYVNKITELKEFVDMIFEHSNFYGKKTDNLEKVMRDFGKRFMADFICGNGEDLESYEEEWGDYEKIFKKLDKDGDSKETHGCFNCQYFIDYNLCNERDVDSFEEFIYTTFLTAICNNWKRKDGEKEPTDDAGSAQQTVRRKEIGILVRQRMINKEGDPIINRKYCDPLLYTVVLKADLEKAKKHLKYIIDNYALPSDLRDELHGDLRQKLIDDFKKLEKYLEESK